VILEEACQDLALPPDIKARAQQVAELGAEIGVTSGVSPYTYAAAALYIASSAADTGLSQADLAEQFDVLTATLRNRRDDLVKAIGSDLFEHQFPTAPTEAILLVDDLLQHAQTVQWTKASVVWEFSLVHGCILRTNTRSKPAYQNSRLSLE